MSADELNKMYTILSYPGDNNHDHFFSKGVYPYIKGMKIDSILDAGCGTGAILKDIANIYSDAEICAIDFTVASLKKAEKNLENHLNVKFKKVDLMGQSIQGIGKFDFIHCQGVLHHLESPETGLKNLIKCLNDGGKLYLWVYLSKGRQHITEIKELMEPFESLEYDDKLRILNNLLKIKKSASRNKKHKRYLRRINKRGILGNIAKLLIMIEEYGVMHTASKVRHIIIDKTLRSPARDKQLNIGRADEFLNPCEHFYTINEFFKVIKGSGLKIDSIVDGVSRGIDDIGSGNLTIEPEIEFRDDKWKWKMIEYFDEPRGIGVLCSKDVNG
jgi:SAM-dependent methyltransferase